MITGLSMIAARCPKNYFTTLKKLLDLRPTTSLSMQSFTFFFLFFFSFLFYTSVLHLTLLTFIIHILTAQRITLRNFAIALPIMVDPTSTTYT